MILKIVICVFVFCFGRSLIAEDKKTPIYACHEEQMFKTDGYLGWLTFDKNDQPIYDKFLIPGKTTICLIYPLPLGPIKTELFQDAVVIDIDENSSSIPMSQRYKLGDRVRVNVLQLVMIDVSLDLYDKPKAKLASGINIRKTNEDYLNKNQISILDISEYNKQEMNAFWFHMFVSDKSTDRVQHISKEIRRTYIGLKSFNLLDKVGTDEKNIEYVLYFISSTKTGRDFLKEYFTIYDDVKIKSFFSSEARGTFDIHTKTIKIFDGMNLVQFANTFIHEGTHAFRALRKKTESELRWEKIFAEIRAERSKQEEKPKYDPIYSRIIGLISNSFKTSGEWLLGSTSFWVEDVKNEFNSYKRGTEFARDLYIDFTKTGKKLDFCEFAEALNDVCSKDVFKDTMTFGIYAVPFRILQNMDEEIEFPKFTNQ